MRKFRSMLHSKKSNFDVVAVGGSAGALEAVQELMGALPQPFRAILIVCLHRPVERQSALPEILSRASLLPVVIPRQGELLRPGVCYLGLPGTHLAVGPQLVAQLVHDGFYRAHNIDLLFSSLARNAGPRTIGVLLSGMLKDGVEGLRAIKEAGGKALAQSPSDAKFGSLPLNALAHDGPIDMVAPVAALATEIGRMIGTAGDLPKLKGQPVPEDREEASR